MDNYRISTKRKAKFKNLNIDTFCRLPVNSARCLSETEKCPDSGILLNYIDDDDTESHSQI